MSAKVHPAPLPTSFLPSLSEGTSLNKWELKEKLSTIIARIEEEKEKNLSYSNLTEHSYRELKSDYQRNSWAVVTKVGVIVVGVGTLAPLTLGSIACFAAFNAAEPNEIFSDNRDVASNAAGLYGNLGHGIGYLLEGMEIIGVSGSMLLYTPYQKAKTKLIEESYQKVLEHEKGLNQQEMNYLYDRKEADIRGESASYWPQLSIPPGRDP